MTGATQREVVKVAFVQLNTAVDTSLYLPYSVALLQAYLQKNAERPERYEFGVPIVQRLTTSAAATAIGDSDIVGFSMYVWNGNRSLAIARELKNARPETLIVFGGPHVPDDAEEFLRKHTPIETGRAFDAAAPRRPGRVIGVPVWSADSGGSGRLESAGRA